MKNYTLRSLYLTLAVVLFSALPRTMNAQVNCATFTTPGTPATLTPTSNWQTVTTQSGRYYTFTATAGCTYTFSHCQAGGNAPVGTDPVLTITDATNTTVAYNDEGTTCMGVSGGAEIIWQCLSTGTYKIHHEKCCCSQAGTPNFATMAYKVACPCDAGVAFASPGTMCVGGNVTLTLSGNSAGSTLQWQTSIDNVNFNNITSGTTTPFVYGPVSATSYFRAIVHCTGVGNTVGYDTTLSVQVLVNPLPTVIFPPQSGPSCCNTAAFTLNTATPSGGTYSGTGVNANQFTPNLICNGTSTITYTYTDGNGCTNTATQPYAVNDTPTVTFPPLTPVCYHPTNQFPLNTATPPGGTYTGPGVTSNIFVINNAGIGNHNILYTYTANGCTSKVIQQQTVWANPTINITAVPAQCNQNLNCASLSATPAGGTWSGTGVVGATFCPYTLIANNYTATYSYTDGNGCSASQNVNVTVQEPNVITWNNAFPVLCDNNNVLNLNGYASPAGGTYSGIGVNANQFNPVGQCNNSPITITYTSTTTAGCQSTSTQQIQVNCSPTVSFIGGPVPPLCQGSAPFSLVPYVTPAGGTFSGGGGFVGTGGLFTPTTAGNYNVIYQYLDLATNCSNSVSFQVQVVSNPAVNLPFTYFPVQLCEGDAPVLLNQGVPAGGVYSGTGVTGSGPYYFDPVLAGADTFMIYYTYVTTGGCGGMDSAAMIVHPGPVINFPPLADVCDDDPLVQLLATPAGGTFTGPYVQAVLPNYYFNPGTAVPGNYWIVYRDTNIVTGCTAVDSQNIIVKPRPGAITISNMVNPTSCGATNGSYRINGLTPNTNYILTYIKNGVLQGPYSIVSTPLGTYTVTGLSAATYNQVLVSLNGCTEITPPAPFSLVDPNAPAAPTAGSNSPLCQYSNLQLTATSGVVNGSYTWTGPNSFFSNQQNPNIVNVGVAASGNYVVTVTNNLNCTSLPTTIAVVVNPAPNMTINSNAPVCAGNSLNLSASSTTTGTTFQWTGPSSFFSPLATPTISNVTTANQGWYYAVATSPNSCTRLDSLLVNVGTITPITPTAGANTPVCSGTNLNLTATNSTAGATYSWTGPTSFTANVQNPTRTAVAVADSGDYIVQAFLNGCNSGMSTIHVQVLQSLTPNITITANPDDTVCFGTNIDFTSVITDGGTSPQYQWYKNGIPVIGAIDSFWGSPYLTNLDTIYAVLINGTTCTTAAADTSNKIAVHMAPNQIPSVSVGSYPFAWVAGQNMTFYANVLNAGTNPTYQWYLNGVILPGETNATYMSNALQSSDILSVTVTSNAPCAIPNTANGDWNAILSMSVNTSGQLLDDLKLYPNPNNGTFQVSGSFGEMTGVKDGMVEVVNAVGQVVFRDKTTINSGKIDKQVHINDIAAGVYIIRVNADGKTAQLRFVVTK